jgi:8-oxo-dGTP pyrophosphatase MutT (NUDIX family)
MAQNLGVLRKVYSLVLIRDFENNKILLGYKKRGFGSNKWNGFGGKVEPFESILECAVR